MCICVVTNDVIELYARQSTAMLIYAACRRGHEVWALGVDDFEMVNDGGLYAWARRVGAADAVEAMLAAVKQADVERLAVDGCDVWLMRTNPARDMKREQAHDSALVFARLAAARGVVVLNDPGGLARASSKLSLLDLPASVRPLTFVSRNLAALEEFLDGVDGPAVIKPVRGTRGQDVFMLDKRERSNRRQILDVIARDGYVMAQEMVAGAERGDQRVLVMNGSILTVGGRPAVIARVPRGDDFRSNIHAGGKAVLGVLTPAIEAVVAQVSGWLVREGLFLVGLDFIGDRIIEVNLFSPGGLFDAVLYHERDFADAIIAGVEEFAGR